MMSIVCPIVVDIVHDEGVHVERNNLDIGEVKENENISENQRNEIAKT